MILGCTLGVAPLDVWGHSKELLEAVGVGAYWGKLKKGMTLRVQPGTH